MAAISYLIALAAPPPRYGLDHEFSIDSDEFLPTITGVSDVPFISGNRVELLNNGDAFYPRMLRDIERAQRSITIEAYIYWAGEVGLQFARALQAKAQAGITIKILLDAIGSATIGEDILAVLEPGCHVAWYNPIRWLSLPESLIARQSGHAPRELNPAPRSIHCACWYTLTLPRTPSLLVAKAGTEVRVSGRSRPSLKARRLVCCRGSKMVPCGQCAPLVLIIKRAGGATGVQAARRL